MKALVVDNDTFFLEFLADLLEGKDIQTIRAFDGKEAIQALDGQTFDVMFVDTVMPKIDGKQLIHYVATKFPEKPFPIVAISGVIVEQLDGLQDIGADYFIAKGPMETMARHIEHVVERIFNTVT